MRRHTVCLHIFIDLTEKIVRLRSTAGPRCAGLCVNNNRIRIDQLLLYERINGECAAGRIAARIRNDTGASDLLPVDFAQTVYCLFDILRRFVLHLVPLFVYFYILQAEICAQVDHLCM